MRAPGRRETTRSVGRADRRRPQQQPPAGLPEHHHVLSVRNVRDEEAAGAPITSTRSGPQKKKWMQLLESEPAGQEPLMRRGAPERASVGAHTAPHGCHVVAALSERFCHVTGSAPQHTLLYCE
jgi:Mlc titration factor MtfA (ptsG expression regulator)